MSIESGVLLDSNYLPIYWHLPEGRTAGSIPDSRTLWEQFWANRHRVYAFAHTHPGSGQGLGPSYTDVTTFAAMEAALGMRLVWLILNEDSAVACTHCTEPNAEPTEYKVARVGTEGRDWEIELRRLSYGTASIKRDSAPATSAVYY